jgi:TonB family protein
MVVRKLKHWLFLGVLLGVGSPASAQQFARECPAVAVGTQDRAVRLEADVLNVVRGAVIALRVAMEGAEFKPDRFHFVRIGSKPFGGAPFHPAMGFSPSQPDPALRFIADGQLFADLLDSRAIELVATDGSRLVVPLSPSALSEARDCIDRYNLPLLDASDAMHRDARSLLRLQPNQRPGVRSQARQRPVYPEAALRDGREGRTIMRITIGIHGRVAACEIAQSSGSPDLDAASCASVNGWIYFPETDANGLPVEVKANQPMVWRLGQ